MSPETDSNEFSILVETNSLLTKELVEKNNLIAGKDQKYIECLETNFKQSLKLKELMETLEQKDAEIAELKKNIDELNEKNFCDDLIELESE